MSCPNFTFNLNSDTVTLEILLALKLNIGQLSKIILDKAQSCRFEKGKLTEEGKGTMML